MVKKNQESEFELIPMSPLRKLEKRIEKIETSTPTIEIRDFLKDVVDIIRMNQGIVDELVKANDSLRIELSRLPVKLDVLISKEDELLSIIKASSTEETAPTSESKPLGDKIGQLVEANKRIVESNEAMLAAIEEIEKRLKKPVILRPPLARKPLPPKKLLPPKS
jgi:hypothetical protein